jgi:4-amino-4-deoxy-L-arabinose transferase-like glycosyltransferase
MEMPSSQRSVAWVLALQLLLVVPFIGQPIHMDDSIFVDIGRNVLRTPGHAHDFPYVFEGLRVSDMASHSHPPFVGYWIGLLLWFFGDGPHLHVMLHVSFLIFPMLFATGVYLLACRFSETPAFAAAVAISSPAAVVSSHTLMSDYPCLAFSTLAVALYVNGVDRKRSAPIWSAGIFLSLAAFCSYPALLFSFLCLLYAWLRGSRMRAAFVAPLIAVAWMSAWLAYSTLYFGRFVIGDTAQYVVQSGGLSGGGLGAKLLVFPIFLAGTLLVLPFPLIRSALRWSRGIPAALWLLCSPGLAHSYAPDYLLADRILVTFFLTVGGWTIIALLLKMRQTFSKSHLREQRQDSLFLALWVGMMTVPILFLYASGAARYMLPLLPPIVLLSFFKSADKPSPKSRWPAELWIAAALIIAISLSIADYRMAQANPDAAAFLSRVLNGWKNKTRFGAEWGFRHYMVDQGFRQFTSTGDDMTGGDFIVLPTEAVPYNLPPDIESMTIPVLDRTEQSSLPVRLMNRAAHAGFYSSSWGLLPFSISRAPLEHISVKQVSYLVERLPEITLENASPDAVVIPSPAPQGGVDVLVPLPGRMRIPYDGPLPVRVEFSCVLNQITEACPMRIFYDSAGRTSEISLQRDNDTVHFDLIASDPGTIILEMTRATAKATGDLTIRNWLMLPLEARQ